MEARRPGFINSPPKLQINLNSEPCVFDDRRQLFRNKLTPCPTDQGSGPTVGTAATVVRIGTVTKQGYNGCILTRNAKSCFRDTIHKLLRFVADLSIKSHEKFPELLLGTEIGAVWEKQNQRVPGYVEFN
ncbi:hypothetical protein GWI33_004967 [Rhynchophorus ferrugineus]|uniref:Uncharacterized protein n=1 Tax=Rhynchophorus ferrugineus TaxID=354439 RepID=A0A834MF25_RHYFE|nr:hypothetical protein GWI33_004967 [Rhynchophorus ferrugineus]